MQNASDYFAENNYEQAAVEYSKVLEMSPDDQSALTAYTFRGYSYFDLGKYELAIPDFVKAIELHSTSIGVQQQLGISYYQTGQYDLAIDQLTGLIDSGPVTSPFMYDDRGLAYFARGDYQLAIDDYTKAVTLFSGDALGYFRRADAYLATGQTDMAIADLNKTISLANDPSLKEQARNKLTSLDTGN